MFEGPAIYARNPSTATSPKRNTTLATELQTTEMTTGAIEASSQMSSAAAVRCGFGQVSKTQHIPNQARSNAVV